MPSNIDAMFFYFIRVRDRHPTIDNDIKSILRQRRSPKDAICMADIRKQYKQLTGDAFPMRCGPLGLGEFLLTIPFVACYCNENGTLFFYSVDPN
ncbi:maternal effect protein oskar [Stomoxys calcitrans]|uniref:maternal effect protein oskar n=1 Tax=Stomoxys calcitrans TaxID=35570 RepID=UPI0027E270BE|nr:maternal effect protein oskar [Stomoxys calcitrans]